MGGSTRPAFSVFLNGKELSSDLVQDIVVDLDLFEPNFVVVTLAHTQEVIQNAHIGSLLTIRGKPPEDTSGKDIFKGEVVGLEPYFRSSGRAQLILRALDPSHKLPRKKSPKVGGKKP